MSDEQCLFCNIPQELILVENSFAFAITDEFPVTEGHSLVIPKNHVDEYFGLSIEELLGCDNLLKSVRRDLLLADNSIKGFNIGMNSGAVAGQTIFHCHIHLIPRREGDVDDPRGGVRNVIPGKSLYSQQT
ncbi:MAG TPA: HIT family protein [Nitrospinaceae bacterium]|nr:HIT family protein [Nitrospinaceae bacterium]